MTEKTARRARRPFEQRSGRYLDVCFVEELFRDSKVEQLESVCRQSLALDPACGPAWHFLAMVDLTEGRLSDAEAKLRLAIEGATPLSESFIELAALIGQRADRSAFALLERAFAINPYATRCALARREFDSWRSDREFERLFDPLPEALSVRPVYELLLRREYAQAAALEASTLSPSSEPALVDAVEFALEQLLEGDEPSPTPQRELQAVRALKAGAARSPEFARFLFLIDWA